VIRTFLEGEDTVRTWLGAIPARTEAVLYRVAPDLLDQIRAQMEQAAAASAVRSDRETLRAHLRRHGPAEHLPRDHPARSQRSSLRAVLAEMGPTIRAALSDAIVEELQP